VGRTKCGETTRAAPGPGLSCTALDLNHFHQRSEGTGHSELVILLGLIRLHLFRAREIPFSMASLDAGAELELATLLSSLQVEREPVVSEIEGE
jgi:hypothetical protein